MEGRRRGSRKGWAGLPHEMRVPQAALAGYVPECKRRHISCMVTEKGAHVCNQLF